MLSSLMFDRLSTIFASALTADELANLHFYVEGGGDLCCGADAYSLSANGATAVEVAASDEYFCDPPYPESWRKILTRMVKKGWTKPIREIYGTGDSATEYMELLECATRGDMKSAVLAACKARHVAP